MTSSKKLSIKQKDNPIQTLDDIVKDYDSFQESDISESGSDSSESWDINKGSFRSESDY